MILLPQPYATTESPGSRPVDGKLLTLLKLLGGVSLLAGSNPTPSALRLIIGSELGLCLFLCRAADSAPARSRVRPGTGFLGHRQYIVAGCGLVTGR